MRSAMLGTGACLPDVILTNHDLAKIVDTSDQWIRERTGIEERHIARDQSLSELSTRAAQQALRNAGIEAEKLSLIICATFTPDFAVPSLSCTLAARLGVNCIAFDINAACSGFVYALAIADSMRAQGQYALVIGAETLSRVTDWTDRSTCVLFGDGAGAAILGDLDGSGILGTKLSTWPDEMNCLGVGGLNRQENGKLVPSYISMDGQETFKFATRTLPAHINETLQSCGLTADDVKWIVPHQANLRIVQLAASRLNVPLERFYMNITRVGNTSSASIPLALHELNEKNELERGDVVVLAAFGGGLTAGTVVLRW